MHILMTLLVAVLAFGCGGNPAASSIATAAPASVDHRSQSAGHSAAAGVRTLASKIYPYALTLDDDAIRSEWRPATTPWDGTSRVDNGSPSTDWVQVTDGNLFAFGAPTDASLSSFLDDLQAGAVASHGCDAEPPFKESLSGGGADGLLTAYACGATQVVRWTSVRAGFGLTIVELLVNADDPEAARERFIEVIQHLRWTKPPG